MPAAVTEIENYEDFVKSHGVLLAASGLAQSLHRKLFQKLTAETFDGGTYFQVEPVEDGRQRRLVLTADFLGKDSDVFLVDHAWTFRLNDAYKQLQEVPGLVERMASLMCVDIDLNSEAEEACDEADAKLSAAEIVEKEFCKVKEEGIASVRWLDLEDLEIDDDMLVSLELASKFPQLLALSLRGNKLKNSEIVVKVLAHLKSLRALWLNYNSFSKTGDNYLEDIVLLNFPELEIYNSRFTPKYGHWALGFCGGLYEKDNPGGSYESDNLLQSVTSLDLSNRCICNLISKALSPFQMPILSYLNIRGNSLNENSVDELVKYLGGFTNLTVLEVDIPGPLGENAVDVIKALPSLSLLNGLTTSKILESEKIIVGSMLKPCLPELNAGESLIDRVVSAMWLYLMTYRLADDEKIDETSVWRICCDRSPSTLPLLSQGSNHMSGGGGEFTTMASVLEKAKAPMSDLTSLASRNPLLSHLEVASVPSSMVVKKAEFPAFDGDDPLTWIAKAEQYFYVQITRPEDRVTLAMLSMDGAALSWVRWIGQQRSSFS